VITLKIAIIDINDNVPTFERPEYHLRLPETAKLGTSFELPVATDADPTPRFGVRWYYCKTFAPEMVFRVTLRMEPFLFG